MAPQIVKFGMCVLTVLLSAWTPCSSEPIPPPASSTSGSPSFATYAFGKDTPPMTLVNQWFKELNEEAFRQGILCYVDMNTTAFAYPGTYLWERTNYNLDWDKDEGYVMKITKVLTNAEGETPVVNDVPLPSSYTCKYWVKSGNETCYCQYPGSENPAEKFYGFYKQSYPVYKRKAYRPASELTVDMFGPNENPESKLKALSRPELVPLLRNMFVSQDGNRGNLVPFPKKLKRTYPEIGFWTYSNYQTSGNEADGYNVKLDLWITRSDEEIHNPVPGVCAGTFCSFNTKTRKLFCGGVCGASANKKDYNSKNSGQTTGDDLDES